MCVNANLRKKRNPTISVDDDLYEQVRLNAEEANLTIVAYVNNLIRECLDKKEFLKFYAPHIKFEFVSSNAIFLNDSEKDKTIVVKLKWNDVKEDLATDAGFTVFCENCDSDSCIHVRYSIAIPEIMKLHKLGK